MNPTGEIVIKKLNFKGFFLIFLSALVSLGILTSCARSPYSLDKKRAVEKTVLAKKGGEISLKTAKEEISLAFPQQALKKDTTLVATPLTKAPLKEEKDVFAKGFLLEEKGKEGEKKSLKLKFPVFLEFRVKGSLPKGATIVKYLPEKKGYEVIPTEITTEGKESILRAELMSLSGYGGKKAKTGEIKKAEKKQEEKGYVWHIKVKDTVKKEVGGIPISHTLSLHVSNISGKVTGNYIDIGATSLKVKAGKQWGPLKVKLDEEFAGSAVIKITTLQKEEEATSFRGEGTLNLAGTAEAESAGPGVTVQLSGAGNTPVAVDVTINGAVVTIKVVRSHPSLAGLTFKGTLVGKQKKEQKPAKEGKKKKK